MSALIDTGFMLAVLAHNDPHHEACRLVALQEPSALIPSVVLPELAYMIIRNMERKTLITFMRELLTDESQVVDATTEDFVRAMEIMEKYFDANLDFVDCTIMAMAERLGISRILTVDRRDFSMFRPKHIPYFTILP